MTTDKGQACSDDVHFARSAIGGKKTAEIKARTSDELKFALQRRCHELGMTESEYIDRLVAVSLFGIEHVNTVEQERTKRVAGLWPDADGRPA